MQPLYIGCIFMAHLNSEGRNMYYLKTSASFDSAHFLYGYEGKCSNIHGHHWVIEAKLSGEYLQTDSVKSGMLVDFSDIKKPFANLPIVSTMR